MAAAVEYFFYDADLLLIPLVGVGMIGVHDAGRVLQIPFLIQVQGLIMEP